MSNKALAGAFIIIAALTSAGTYLAITKKPPTAFTITLTGANSVSVDSTKDYTVTVFQGNSPVTGASVSLKDSAGTIGTATTDTTGTATFSVKFTSSGTDTLYAEYNGIKSSSLTVTVSSTPPPSGCISCSDCPPGYNCINGTCEELIPAFIKMPVTVYPPSVYFQFTKEQNNLIYETYALLTMPSASNSCPSTILNIPSNTSVVKISGTVVDSAGHGVNGVNVRFSLAGGGNWTAGNPGVNAFSGNTSLVMKSDETVTDCNGNFTAEILVTVGTSYYQSLFANYNTPFFTIPTPTGTLTVVSGSLASVETIITFNDFISAYICNYVNGVLV